MYVCLFVCLFVLFSFRVCSFFESRNRMGIPPFFSVIQGLEFWDAFFFFDRKRWEMVLHFLKSIQYPVLLFFCIH